MSWREEGNGIALASTIATANQIRRIFPWSRPRPGRPGTANPSRRMPTVRTSAASVGCLSFFGTARRQNWCRKSTG